MENLYILNEIFTNGLSYNALNIISILSLISGILVIISKNPIVSVLFLIGLFLGIASYLMMLGINFIGLSYLLVYVGAVSILFLFILMLINVRISELVTDNNNSIPLAIMIGIIFNGILHKLLPSSSVIIHPLHIFEIDRVYSIFSFGSSSSYPRLGGFFSHLNEKQIGLNTEQNYQSYNSIYNNFMSFNSNKLSFVSSHIWDGSIAEASHITSIGNIIYSVYPIWLILTSIILLLAMVGAIVITIKQ